MKDIFPKEVQNGIAFVVKWGGETRHVVFIRPDKLKSLVEDDETSIGEFLKSIIGDISN